MAELPKRGYVNLAEAMRKVVSAHQAVTDGIATHAEKETAARQAANHKRQTDEALKLGMVSRGT